MNAPHSKFKVDVKYWMVRWPGNPHVKSDRTSRVDKKLFFKRGGRGGGRYKIGSPKGVFVGRQG